MQNMAFIIQSHVELSDIAELAKKRGYRVDLFFDMREWLNVYLDEDQGGLVAVVRNRGEVVMV